ncbi:hypothetical protein EST38_g3518 [Candolleomyces aberdarensis]|uniref:Inositol polyphosphate-related phosphatase domain-containing protein n=1 Tax=Candolleomyces aberdarensis TaxID=2316362 RepID=A0A4V1Q4J6_9AGAR|nr:hypothetical protein EST38_g3518 [Candolleomyces aberdarensis]
MATVNPNKDGLLVQIASYNTNLQGILGLPQDLVDWLSPTLQVSKFLSGGARAPDIVAVGFQELLPLHLGLAGLSKAILDNRNALILSQIEAHAPNKEKYSLVAKIANVGIALLVYARDDGVARRVTDVQTAWTGCGPGYMGNKGAVGIRFRVAEDTAPEGGETFTFVNCHLTPFNHKVKQRLNDYKHIVSTLLFPPSSAKSKAPSTLYDTSHLFVFGDMNFRVDLPSTHPLSALVKTSQFSEAISSGSSREELKEFDQLTNEKNKGNVFVGLHEGEFWKFKCSYKYKVGEVDQYSVRRIPSWTDRILYATHKDTPDQSAVKNLLYTSIPSYTTSDHKPIITLLLLPPRDTTSSKIIPKLTLPSSYHPVPDPNAGVKRWTGRVLDRFIGVIWWVFTLLGAGSGLFGFVNFFVGLCAFTWWKGRPLNATNNV